MSGGRLEGKVAIVTGGGRGLGRAMVLGLAAAGARVIATAAREAAEIEAVARESGNGRIIPMIADVAREEDCARVVALVRDRFRGLDILINNAGRGMKYVSERFLTEPTRFWEIDPDVWRMVIDTNVNGPFLMARAAATPAMPSASTSGTWAAGLRSRRFATRRRSPVRTGSTTATGSSVCGRG